MKRLTRRDFTAAGILAALGAGTFLPSCDVKGCSADPDPSDNQNVDVYGPPPVEPSEWEQEDDAYDPGSNSAAMLYGPPFVDPSEWGRKGFGYDLSRNELVDVYGPPPGD